MSERLCILHARLTLDHANAFTTEGEGPRIVVTPTDAGRAWLRDLARYHREWNNLRRKAIDPGTILRQRFGYIAEELPPDDPEPATEPCENNHNVSP